jgi:hypothetical protein
MISQLLMAPNLRACLHVCGVYAHRTQNTRQPSHWMIEKSARDIDICCLVFFGSCKYEDL